MADGLAISDLTSHAITQLEHQRILDDPVWKQFEEVLGKPAIEQALVRNNWDEDATINDLISLASPQEDPSQKQKQQNQAAVKAMQDAFKLIPLQKIEETVQKNNGDLDAVLQELIFLNQDFSIQQMATKYRTTVERVRQLFKENGDNERKINTILIKEEAEARVRQHQHEFPMFTEDELLTAYFSNNSNEQKWLEDMKNRVRKIQAEEAESLRKAQELALKAATLKQEEENLRKAQEEEARRKLEMAQKEANEKRKKEEEARIAEETKARIAEEARIAAARKKIEEEAALEKVRAEKAQAEAQAERARIAKQKEEMLHQSVLFAEASLKEQKEKHAQVVEKFIRNNHGASPQATEPKPSEPAAEMVVELSLDRTRVDVGGMITVTWKHTAEPSSQDWIGLFKVGGQKHLTYEYVKGSSEKRSGAVTFNAPNDFGLCEFRYIYTNKRNQYQNFGISQQFRIGPSFEITKEIVNDEIKVHIKKQEGQAHPKAWCAVFPANSSDYLKPYHYVESDKTVTFQIPKKSGLYQVKLFAASGLDTFAGAVEHRVAGDDKLELLCTDNATIIKYDLSSVDAATDRVWVGLYKVEQQSNDQWVLYTWLTSNKGETTMKRPSNPSGKYELRLFAYNSLRTITTSNGSQF